MKHTTSLILMSILTLVNCSSSDDNRNQKNFACDEPITFLMTSVSINSKLIKWNELEDPISYTIRHGIAGFDVEDEDSNLSKDITTNNSSLTFEYVTSTGFRELYIRSNCANDISSDWIGPFDFFSNGSDCGVSSITASPNNDNGSRNIFLNWGATWKPGNSATNWTIEYGLTGFELGTGTTVITNNDSQDYLIENLETSTTYDFYIKGNCGNGGDSLYTGFITATTE